MSENWMNEEPPGFGPNWDHSEEPMREGQVRTDRFLAGAVLVCCGALLAAGGQVAGPVGAGFVADRGCELMGIPSPGGADALAYVSAVARAVMARWPRKCE